MLRLYVTASVHGHLCLVYMNCENHVGGAMYERQLSNFSVVKGFFFKIKVQYLCVGVSVCICGSSGQHIALPIVSRT